MDIQAGAKVRAKDGTVLGTVDHIMHNTLTGEISKFIVNRKPPLNDLFFTPEDVLDIKDSSISVNVESEKAAENR